MPPTSLPRPRGEPFVLVLPDPQQDLGVGATGARVQEDEAAGREMGAAEDSGEVVDADSGPVRQDLVLDARLPAHSFENDTDVRGTCQRAVACIGHCWAPLGSGDVLVHAWSSVRGVVRTGAGMTLGAERRHISSFLNPASAQALGNACSTDFICPRPPVRRSIHMAGLRAGRLCQFPLLKGLLGPPHDKRVVARVRIDATDTPPDRNAARRCDEPVVRRLHLHARATVESRHCCLKHAYITGSGAILTSPGEMQLHLDDGEFVHRGRKFGGEVDVCVTAGRGRRRRDVA